MDGCRTVEKVIIFPVYEMETGKISGSHFYRNYPGIPVYAKKFPDHSISKMEIFIRKNGNPRDKPSKFDQMSLI